MNETMFFKDKYVLQIVWDVLLLNIICCSSAIYFYPGVLYVIWKTHSSTTLPAPELQEVLPRSQDCV